ncbi:MAG TPA: GNAT family N-acetyltransferase [Mycobacteriales bacterium]|nr:GNAT family N-acetyltransferase [Mycobacteriales bacterium]
MEIKRVGKDEEAWLLRAYAFGQTPVTTAQIEEHRSAPDSDTVNLLAYEPIDGPEPEAVAVVGGIPLQQNVRGRVVPMLGVTGVASHPAARRRGHVRTLLDRLHREMRDEGFVTAVLYPFRPTFYERFGYVGFPKARSIRLSPRGLRRTELPGSVTLHRIGEEGALQTGWDYLQQRMQTRHGFALGSAERHRAADSADDHWVVYARDAAGSVVGMLQYRTGEFGDELRGRDFLASNPLGRMLLVQWLARHADQYAWFSFELPPDERPDLWDTDIIVEDRTRIESPTHSAPMGRVLSVPGLSGLRVQAAEPVTVEVVDDPLAGGTWTLDGTDPAGLQVYPGRSEPAATLTSHGLAGLVFGTLDPDEVELRGFGSVPAEAAEALATLFPRAWPHVYSTF